MCLQLQDDHCSSSQHVKKLPCTLSALTQAQQSIAGIVIATWLAIIVTCAILEFQTDMKMYNIQQLQTYFTDLIYIFYLLIISVGDFHYKGINMFNQAEWSSSFSCMFARIACLFSLIGSLWTGLVGVSLKAFAITFPFRYKVFTKVKLMYFLIMGWAFIVLSVILTIINHFLERNELVFIKEYLILSY